MTTRAGFDEAISGVIHTAEAFRLLPEAEMDYSALFRELNRRMRALEAEFNLTTTDGSESLCLRLHPIGVAPTGKPLSFHRPFVVGRSPQAGLTFDSKGDCSVSRIHAFLYHDGQCWYVADLGSSNGTFRNGLRIRHVVDSPLRLGDVIQFGNQSFQVNALMRQDVTPLFSVSRPNRCSVRFRHAVTLYRTDPTGQEIVGCRTFNTGEVWDGLTDLIHMWLPVKWFCTESEDGWYFGPLSDGDIEPAHVFPMEYAVQSWEPGTPFYAAWTGYTYIGPGWLRFHRSTWATYDPVKIQAGEVRWVADALKIESPVAIEPLGDSYEFKVGDISEDKSCPKS
jgi:hypothetical protein